MELIERDGFWVRKDFEAQDLVIVHDIYRNDAYRLQLIRERVEQARLIVDIGAHIGCFARLVQEMNPHADVVCVEACHQNLEALHRNVDGFADVYYAACTYDPRPQVLWNAFTDHGCESTGGSRVQPIDRLRSEQAKKQYRWDGIELVRITLEQIRDRFEGHRIDLLKLDCEGSEFSILANCELDGIGFIVGEYHGRQEWDLLRKWRMPHWDYGHMSESGNLGNFHLRNPHA